MSTPTAAGMLAAIDQYLEHGPDAVWDCVRELARIADDRFSRIPGVELASPRSDETRSGLFLFRPGDLDATAVVAWLFDEGRIACRAVPQVKAVRLSLNVYNNEEDIEHTAALVERALAEGIPERPAAH